MSTTSTRTLLASAVIAAVGLSVASGAAEAKKPKSKAKTVSHCTGTKLESKALKFDGKKRGHVELWYSSKDNGTNCVITYDDAKGKRLMSASLVVQNRKSSGDVGTFEHYAGGAAVTNTNGQCVQWGGYAYFGGKQFMYINDRWTHCG